MSKFLLAVTMFTVFSICKAYADQHLTLIQDLPVITHISVGDGESLGAHGDLMAFEASFTSSQGESGVMNGILITVDIPSDAGGYVFDRVAQIVFDFGGVDTIVVGGKTVYPGGRMEMLPNERQIRAIVGGTGRVIGAPGQVETTRYDKGHYEHQLLLMD